MLEKEVIGTIGYDSDFEEWYLDLEGEQIYAYDVLAQFNKMLGREVQDGERFKIIVKKI